MVSFCVSHHCRLKTQIRRSPKKMDEKVSSIPTTTHGSRIQKRNQKKTNPNNTRFNALQMKSESGFNPPPQDQWFLLNQGAEARIWKVPAIGEGGSPMICKERFSKAYRHPELDERLIKSRTKCEARILEKCEKKSNIRVPKVVRVEKSLLYMEYIQGRTLKEHIKKFSPAKDGSEKSYKIDFTELAITIGSLIGRLHGLGVIHGDLTSSNILVSNSNSIEKREQQQEGLVLIDFGLAKSTSSVEEQAVDLYVLERALQSTHPNLPENFFDTILQAYADASSTTSTNKKTQTNTLQRLEQVRLRGRKRECFG